MGNKRLWTALVEIIPAGDDNLEDLIDLEGINDENEYLGAWANVMVESDDILTAHNIILQGLAEKRFKVIDFEYLDDYSHYKDVYETGVEFDEAEELLRNSSYRFCIIGKLFPFTEIE